MAVKPFRVIPDRPELVAALEAKASQLVASRISHDATLVDSGLPPIGITRPVKTPGKLVATFHSTLWKVSGGTPTLTQGYTGFDANGVRTGIVSRTGQTQMLKVVPLTNGSETIAQDVPYTIHTPSLAGQVGLWVYLENQPGYEGGGIGGQGYLTLQMITAGLSFSTDVLSVTFTVNQLREGWNYLKFVMRNPAAYVTGSGIVEDHPFGVAAGVAGNSALADIVTRPVTRFSILVNGLLGSTLYFDSIWTDQHSTPQVVFGVDAASPDTVDIALPKFAAKGWIAYAAITGRIWAGEPRILANLASTYQIQYARSLYAAGWEICNHTVNHLPGSLASPGMRALTIPGEIAYEVNGIHALLTANGMTRGVKFYVSPQSQTSRLAEKVIKECGYLMQRHSRKSNISVTPWGIDNPHHVGAADIGNHLLDVMTCVTGGVSSGVPGLQKFSKIKRYIDMMVAYGDSFFPFWHDVTLVGDTGSGEDATGTTAALTASAMQKTLDYVETLEAQGKIHVCDGFTGFYYGIGR